MQIFLKLVLSLIIIFIAIVFMQVIWSSRAKVDLRLLLTKPLGLLPVIDEIPQPQIEFMIASEGSFFSKGTEVDGVVWEKDMRRCSIYFKNTGEVDIHDLQVEMEIPAPIAGMKIRYQKNCEAVNVFEPLTDKPIIIDEKGKTSFGQGYRRQLEMSASRIAGRVGTICIGLILLDIDDNLSGKISLNCKYGDKGKEFSWKSKMILPPNKFITVNPYEHQKGGIIVELSTKLSGILER